MTLLLKKQHRVNLLQCGARGMCIHIDVCSAFNVTIRCIFFLHGCQHGLFGRCSDRDTIFGRKLATANAIDGEVCRISRT